MTRQRKEIQKEMELLEREESAEYAMGCGFGASEVAEAFAPLWEEIYKRWAATYGQTVAEHDKLVFERQNEAYEAGRIPWSPCYGASYM